MSLPQIFDEQDGAFQRSLRRPRIYARLWLERLFLGAVGVGLLGAGLGHAVEVLSPTTAFVIATERGDSYSQIIALMSVALLYPMLAKRIVDRALATPNGEVGSA